MAPAYFIYLLRNYCLLSNKGILYQIYIFCVNIEHFCYNKICDNKTPVKITSSVLKLNQFFSHCNTGLYCFWDLLCDMGGWGGGGGGGWGGLKDLGIL